MGSPLSEIAPQLYHAHDVHFSLPRKILVYLLDYFVAARDTLCTCFVPHFPSDRLDQTTLLFSSLPRFSPPYSREMQKND